MLFLKSVVGWAIKLNLSDFHVMRAPGRLFTCLEYLSALALLGVNEMVVRAGLDWLQDTTTIQGAGGTMCSGVRRFGGWC